MVPLNVNSFLVTTKGVKNPKGLNLGDLLHFTILNRLSIQVFEIFFYNFQNDMVYKFGLQKALEVEYIPALQELERSNIQDNESVVYKPEGKVELKNKMNQTFEPEFTSENTLLIKIL